MSSYETVSLSMIIVSSLSAIGSLSIILCYCHFKDLQIKQTYQVINYFAVSTFLSSIGSSIGIARSGSFLCWFEGIITNIFTLSSVAWTVVINYMMYSLIQENTFTITSHIHLLCWCLPTIVSLLPLVNSTYGTRDHSWCFIVSSSRNPYWMTALWYWLSFYMWMWLAVIINIVIYLRIYVIMKYHMTIDTYNLYLPIVRRLQLYPIIIVLSWTLSTVIDTSSSSGFMRREDGIELWFGNVIPCFQGTLSTMAFWYMLDVLKLWNDSMISTDLSRLNRRSLILSIVDRQSRVHPMINREFSVKSIPVRQEVTAMPTGPNSNKYQSDVLSVDQLN